MEQPDWTLLFQHLPKTGGVTLSLLIVQNFAKNEVFHIRTPRFPKAPYFSNTYGPVEEFKTLPVSERSRFKCLLGHMRFGIHEYVPGCSKYVAMLRDPIERVLSHHGQYNAMVRNKEMGDVKTLSLEEYLDEKRGSAENHQARFVVKGDFDMMNDMDSLRQARHNLEEHYALVGVTERFDECVLVLNRLMGWPTIAYVPQNVGLQRSRGDQCPRELIELIRSKNSVDHELHAYANHRLDQAVANYGPGFQQDLAKLRRANLRKLKRTKFLARLRSLKARMPGIK